MKGSETGGLSECKALREEIRRIVSEREKDVVVILDSLDGSDGIRVEVWLEAELQMASEKLGYSEPRFEERSQTILEALKILLARIRTHYGITGG